MMPANDDSFPLDLLHHLRYRIPSGHHLLNYWLLFPFRYNLLLSYFPYVWWTVPEVPSNLATSGQSIFKSSDLQENCNHSKLCSVEGSCSHKSSFAAALVLPGLSVPSVVTFPWFSSSLQRFGNVLCPYTFVQQQSVALITVYANDCRFHSSSAVCCDPQAVVITYRCPVTPINQCITLPPV